MTILGKPVMEYLIEHPVRYGITEIMINVAFYHKKIEEYFGDSHLRKGAKVIRSVLFEYTRIGEGMEFSEMIVSPRYCVDRAGDTTYVGDDRCHLRWGDARVGESPGEVVGSVGAQLCISCGQIHRAMRRGLDRPPYRADELRSYRQR